MKWIIQSFRNKPLHFLSFLVCIPRSHWNPEHQFWGARPQPAVPAAPSQNLQALLRLPGQVLWIPLWCQCLWRLQGKTPVPPQTNAGFRLHEIWWWPDPTDVGRQARQLIVLSRVVYHGGRQPTLHLAPQGVLTKRLKCFLPSTTCCVPLTNRSKEHCSQS